MNRPAALNCEYSECVAEFGIHQQCSECRIQADQDDALAITPVEADSIEEPLAITVVGAYGVLEDV